MLIRDLFVSNVTRDIPPVVYFHEQSPAKLQDEVTEYIVTGGWPPEHPHHKRVPNGIHEQYVRLLSGIATELEKKGGPELPASWISGFYGSGKSSFAKLLGLALDGVVLPDGRPLADAWLQRDTSPLSSELRQAWNELRAKVDPIAVVFDIGAIARDDEHIHTAVVRQVQKRLGYCAQEPLVAEYELKLERDGHWSRFEQVALDTLGRPWAEAKQDALADDTFSLVLSKLFPELYPDPMAWFGARAGSFTTTGAAVEDASRAIADMLTFRAPGRTLFLVVDEVSQYVHQAEQRMLKLQSFVSDLGHRLKGRAWLLATGQERLEDDAGHPIAKMKDRFPPRLRVHLAPTNIRDVVHKRLLQKTPAAEATLRALFDANRASLSLYAYGAEKVTAEEFVETYPMLPGHIELLLDITSELRRRSTRSQGDDQAIRGLLQLLGELFRERRLADREVGTLVTLDEIFEVQHTALDSDVQATFRRILAHCSGPEHELALRAAKAVALLQLLQETIPTDAKLVARCLYDRVDLGDRESAVKAALDELKGLNLLGYSEKQGYKIQSSAGEEWERERREVGVGREQIGELVQQALSLLLAGPERPRLQGRPFPWTARFSDGRRADDVVLVDARDDATLTVDFRFLPVSEQSREVWIKRSDESALRDRIVWLGGDTLSIEDVARRLGRSRAMVDKYKPRKESLTRDKQRLLIEEEAEAEELEKELRKAVDQAWLSGQIYFRARSLRPRDHGASFATVLHAVGNSVLAEVYPHFVATAIAPGELMQLVDQRDLSAPSEKFMPEHLGILELDAGKYVSSCSGVVPQRILSSVEAEGGVSGAILLARFGGPPYGWHQNVVRACVAGLLRGHKVKVRLESDETVTSVRDPGVRDLFEKDRALRRATVYPAGEGRIGPRDRARICKFFEEVLGTPLDRENEAIADAVQALFPGEAERLRQLEERLGRLPTRPAPPEPLVNLGKALEDCLRCVRKTEETVVEVKRHVDRLQDGILLLRSWHAELTDDAIRQVSAAHDVYRYRALQLRDVGKLDGPVADAAVRIESQVSSPRAWQDVGGVAADVEAVKGAYAIERRHLLAQQELQAEEARSRVKARDGFSTLNGDQTHQVLRPIALALTTSTEEAVAPPLAALGDAFLARLARAEEEANAILDDLLSGSSVIRKVDLKLKNREIASQSDLEALLAEIRTRLEAQLAEGVRVRIS